MNTSEQNRALEETRGACITHPETCSSGGTLGVWIYITHEHAGVFIDSSSGTSISMSDY